MLKEVLTDVTRITKGLEFATIKVDGTTNTAQFKTMSSDGTILMKAETKNHVPEISGVFGLQNLDILRGYLEIYNSYDTTTPVTLEVVERDRNGVKVLTDIKFKAKGQSTANYRLTGEQAISKVLVLNGIAWDVTLNNIQRSKISEISKFNSVLTSVEKRFKVSTEDGKLIFYIGDEAASTSTVKIEVGEVDSTLNSKFSYPIKEFLNILGNQNPIIKFSNKGICMISFETEHVKYEFTFRAGN